MSKISADHLARHAYVYIRQSTLDQVQHHRESQRRQYGLSDRARQLGGSEVVVIDDDQGRSGAGGHRPGFERLLAALCEGRVGAVFCLEASRLARNGRDWHTLLEFCRLVNTLLIDEDGIYDPRQPNDRLVLGMKGTLSEMELSTFRQRAHAALDQKARRGELLTTVPIGFVRTADNRIELDPDQRIREAVALVFRKFRECRSVRQVLLWLRQERIELPAVVYAPHGRHVVWKLPIYNTLYHILTNPIYGGAYAFGRTQTRARVENGRQRLSKGHRLAPSEWSVLLTHHHDGYIDWDEYQSHQRAIADNANRRGSMVRGAVKRGPALLAGLLRCGHCGRKLPVAYSGTRGDVIRYDCRGRRINHGGAPCISFGGLRAEARVVEAVLRQLTPLGLQASLAAIEQARGAGDERLRQKELALEQARYEAARARRQYDAVDPQNRLVAAELERRWNDALTAQAALEAELQALQQTRPDALSPAVEAELLKLGQDVSRLWHHPAGSPEIRKHILRTVLKEIVATVRNDTIALVLHWQGGDHTALEFTKNRTGHHRWITDTDTVELIRQLARALPDAGIAAVLNRLGQRTAHGHTWTALRVCGLRKDHGIAVYQEGERQARGELTLDEAATQLGVSRMTVLRLIQRQVLPATQACVGAPWLIRQADLLSATLAVRWRDDPQPADSNQLTIDLQ